jgi:hypothetical protein
MTANTSCSGALRRIGGLLSGLFVLFTVILASTAHAGCVYVDPQVSLEGYKRYCSCMGGTFYMRPIRCDMSGSSGSSGSVGFSPAEQLFMQSMQNFFHNLFWGSNQQDENARREAERSRQMEMERQRKRMQEDMEYLRRREEQRRREFQKSKERMLALIGSSGTETLQPREVNTLPELQVHEVNDTFGVKTLKPRNLSTSTQMARTGLAGSPSLKRNCSSYLMQKAKEASAAGRLEDAAYLSNEAANLMSGVTDSPGVVCPPPPEVPDVEGVPLLVSEEQAEKLKKETVVMGRLYNEASQQLADYRAIMNSVTRAEQKVEEAQTRVKEAREQKEKLEAQIRQYPEKVTDTGTSEPQPSLQQPENQSAMEEALEALRQAEAAFKASEQELAGYQNEKVEMEDHIKHTRDLFVQATEDPNKLNALYEEYSSAPQKSDQR